MLLNLSEPQFPYFQNGARAELTGLEVSEYMQGVVTVPSVQQVLNQ
jgi:hypothetical protein